MKKILVYGAGSGNRQFKSALDYTKVEIVAYIDDFLHGKIIDNKPVILPTETHEYEYDYIVIATIYYHQLFRRLQSIGIEKEKIIGLYNIPSEIQKSLNRDIDIINQFTTVSIEPYALCRAC